jgi:N-methylhydantoinase A/oxoprolinase/acetone carboxylase beta subunit
MHTEVLIGVDVGGTFTDAVAVRAGAERAGAVLATAKVPTEPEHLARSLLGALDAVLAEIPAAAVRRVALSTTLITNLLAQGRVPEVALLLIPGPGRDPAAYRLPGRAWVVEGAVDFRGRETVPLDEAGLDAALAEIAAAGYRHVAVVGKFSPRNPAHERRAAARARQVDAIGHVRAGHTISGQLNFPRRAAATAFTLAVAGPYRAFFAQVRAVLGERGLTCPIVVLKGDGGTLPLEAAAQAPLDSIFSGPAASVMGALALRPEGATSVVADVGGTTTDLGLILDGDPLFASQGAALGGARLPLRAFATRSVLLGGDSTLAREEGRVVVRATRAGVAACLGGPAPTLTDALRVLGRAEVGDLAGARVALAPLGDPEAVAEAVVEHALARLEAAVAEMFAAWRREPVYRLWELRRKRGERRPDVLVGLGAAAPALVPALAARLGVRGHIPPHAPVANALGAAVARTTYTTTVHIDTGQRRLEVAEAGYVAPLPSGRYTLDRARALAREWMVRRGERLGIADPLADVVEVLAEQFNVVEGWHTTAQIFDVRLERRCGLVVTVT